MYRGIDVSKYQGNINWAKVKNQVDFVILKAVSTNRTGLYIDPTFEKNYMECKKLGIPVGAYYYTYATDKLTVQAETNLFLKAIQNKSFEYPLVIDVEDNLLKPLSAKELTKLVNYAAEILEGNNLYTMIYTYVSYAQTELNMNDLAHHDRWIAHYASKCKYRGNYGIWQYSSKGRIDGIHGNVDLNISYKDYPSIIKHAGLNGFGEKKQSQGSKPFKKSNVEIAKEVINKMWGNGEERKNRLQQAGYNYKDIQAEVNKWCDYYIKKNQQSNLKPYSEIAREVYRGNWGNGKERIKRLQKAGYNYEKVQEKVEEIIRQK